MPIPTWVAPSEAALEARLRTHPDLTILGASADGIEFEQFGRRRRVAVESGEPLYGLPELMDNNPLVCADGVSVPSPEGTLALIAIGPLVRAGLLVEPPTLIFSFEAAEDLVNRALVSEGWKQGSTVATEVSDLGTVRALTAMAVINTLELASLDELDELYHEAYARSFYVRREEDQPWDVALVSGKPHATFRLRILPDEPHSLLTVQVLADIEGKLGSAQLVHAMNIMAGFEESLGIA